MLYSRQRTNAFFKHSIQTILYLLLSLSLHSTLAQAVEMGGVPKTKLVLADYHFNKNPDSRNLRRTASGRSYQYVGNGFDLKSRLNQTLTNPADGLLGYEYSSRPVVGVTYLGDRDYYEAQLLFARAAGIQGFVFEWGFTPFADSSADLIMQSMKQVLSGIDPGGTEFSIAPLWLQNFTIRDSALSPLTEDERIIYRKTQYRNAFDYMQTHYYQSQDSQRITHNSEPLIFMLDFGDYSNPRRSLTEMQFGDFLDNYPTQVSVLRRMSASPNLEGRWSYLANVNQVKGSFPWLPQHRPAPDASQSTFVREHYNSYIPLAQAQVHGQRIDSLNTKYMADIDVNISYPGFNNISAPWTGHPAFMARQSSTGKNTLEAVWETLLGLTQKPDIVITETFNDFAEGTHIEPTIEDQFTALKISAEQVCNYLDEGNAAQCRTQGEIATVLACHAENIFHLRKFSSRARMVLADDRRLDYLDTLLNQMAKDVYFKRPALAKSRALKAQTEIRRLPLTIRDTSNHSHTATRVGTSTTIGISNIPAGVVNGYLKMTIAEGTNYTQSVPLTIFQGTTEIAKFYLQGNQQSLTIQTPLNRPTPLNDNPLLASNFRIEHDGYDISQISIYSRSYQEAVQPYQVQNNFEFANMDCMNGYFNWGDNNRRALPGDIFDYNNPFTGDTEYFRLYTGAQYGNFKIDKRDDSFFQYLGAEPPTNVRATRFWNENNRQGIVGDIYLYGNPYTYEIQYFELAQTWGNGGYWYFPIDKTDNYFWRYLGNSAELKLFDRYYPQAPNTDIVLETESMSSSVNKGDKRWIPVSNNGYSGGQAMQSMPDTGAFYDDIANQTADAPVISYNVHFSTPGTYYVIVRGEASKGTSDSIHVGVNGVPQSSGQALSGFLNGLGWYQFQHHPADSKATITVETAGRHTINIWPREDGVVIDKLILTQNRFYPLPANTGPAETRAIYHP